MAALGPESKAIFDTAAATSKFADNEAMKRLSLLRAGNRVKNQKSALQARRDRFNVQHKNRVKNLKLDKRSFAFDKKQGKRAALISGLSLIPKAYLGYKSYQQSGKTADDKLKAADRIRSMTASIGG